MKCCHRQTPASPRRVAPPRGERGLKCYWPHKTLGSRKRRSPLRGAWIEIFCPSPPPCGRCRRSPLRGAWIEIASPPLTRGTSEGRSPLRGAWIEIRLQLYGISRAERRSPLRGAWIEIHFLISAFLLLYVAPPRGERGLKSIATKAHSITAPSLPLVGSVD